MKPERPSHILVLCDLEGSSGCFSRRAAEFPNRDWARSCGALTRDVDAVVTALFDSGVRHVTVKDFHRTGHNLFTKDIDRRADIIPGYRNGTVPGMGNLEGIDGAVFIGMHASSGSEGFLAHTLTSRIARLSVGGKALSELQLFSAALSAAGIRPLFFSGCPVACGEAKSAIRGIRTFEIDKSIPGFDAVRWRKRLAAAAAASLAAKTKLYNPTGPFTVTMTMRDGEKTAQRFASQWKLRHRKDSVIFAASDMRDIYIQLTSKLYVPGILSPFTGILLPLYNAVGRLGIIWAESAAQRRR